MVDKLSFAELLFLWCAFFWTLMIGAWVGWFLSISVSQRRAFVRSFRVRR